MAKLAQSTTFNARRNLEPEKRAAAVSCLCPLLFCLLVLATALLGLVQSLSLFFISPQSLVLSTEHSWLYCVISSVLLALYLSDAVRLFTRCESQLESFAFILLHCQVTMQADLILLIYFFCLPVSLAGFKLGAILLYATLLLRLLICHCFARHITGKLVYE